MNPSDPPTPPEFDLLFNAAPGLLLAVRADDGFHIAAASDSYLRATMTRREDIVGRPIFDVFPDNPDDPAARSVQGVREAFERVRRERTLVTMPVYQHDLRRPEAEGGGFERRFWQTGVWPVPADAAAAGDLRYLLCRVEDVTARMRSERECEDTHTRLEATLAATEMGTWIWEVETNRVFADRNLARMFNVSAADADGGPVERYLPAIHPDDLASVQEAISHAVRDGSSYVVEYRLARPGGYRWIVARGWAERDADGRVRRFPGVVLDVTERKLSEQSLRENEERLRMAVESARLGTFDFDPQTGVLTWSDVFREMFGVPLGVAVSYETTFRQALHPDDRDRALAAVAEAMRPGGDGRYDIEYRVCPPGQDPRWIAAAGRGFFDAEGRPRRFIGTVLDITGRKLAEQAAERRTVQLQKLATIAGRLNAAHDVRSVLGILTEEARQLIGARQSITQADAAARAQDGQPLTVVSRPDFDPAAPESAPLPVSPDAGEENELSVPLIGRNAQRLGVIQLTAREDRAFDTDDAALLAQLSQIAAGAIENARLYEELRGNDRRKDEFLAMLAHELRNPLSAILNAVALGGSDAPAEDVAWSMEVIQRQLRQLTRLIDDLLDVSRITRGKVQLRKELLDATQVLESAVEAVRGLIDERRHELTISVGGAMPLHADPTRLEQILVNLLTNAARYTDFGGQISLSAGRENGHVVIRIRDNGLGIPPEKLPQMFELFAQGDRALARSEGGLGVGLTIVRSLTEMHGGTVQAHSEGAGQGSEFVLRLPVAPDTGAASGAAVAAGAGVASPAVGALGRALVVDDNTDSANGTARVLARHGYEVKVAYDGPAAVEAARGFQPRFVLLDIGLPGMDGYEVARRLREDAGLPGVKLIAVSGYGQEGDRRRSREAGFDHHLVKPVDPDKLLALMREAG